MRGCLRSVYGALLVLCASTSIVTAAAHGAGSGEVAQPIIAASTPPVVASPSAVAPPIRTIPSLRELPFRFEPNRGQADPRAKFIARSPGIDLYLTEAGAVLAFRPRPAVPSDAASSAEHRSGAQPDTVKDLQALALRLRFAHANPHPIIEGLDPLPGYSNYFIGNDPMRWHTKIPQFARVRYRDVYPGINVVYYGKEGRIEYDIEVAPGADPAPIRERIDGADALTINRDGDLIVHTALGDVTQRKPTVYQVIDGGRRELGGQYVLPDVARTRSPQEVAFSVTDYDRRYALVLDPPITFAGGNWYGGSQDDLGKALTLAGNNAVLVGQAPAGSVTVTPGAYTTLASAKQDVFVAKIDRGTGNAIYTTIFGGSDDDVPNAAAGNADGSAFIGGYTLSSNFPTVGAIGTCVSSVSNAFIIKISDDGSSVLLSGCLGEPGSVTGIAVGANGDVNVVGQTSSPTFLFQPNGWQQTSTVGNRSWLEAFNATTGALLYGTYISGNGTADNLWAITTDYDDNVLVTGDTSSTSINGTSPVTIGPGGGKDGVLVRFAPTLDSVSAVTRFGGTNDDTALAIAVDGLGHAYIVGKTASTDWGAPAPDALNSAGFLIKLSYDTTILLDHAQIAGQSVTGSTTIVKALALDEINGLVFIGGNSSDIASVPRPAEIAGLGCGSSCSAGTGGFLGAFMINPLTQLSGTGIVNGNSTGDTEVEDLDATGDCSIPWVLNTNGNLAATIDPNPGGETAFFGVLDDCDPNGLKRPLVDKRFLFENGAVVERTGVLQFRIRNPNATALTNFNLTDALPSCVTLLDEGPIVNPPGCLPGAFQSFFAPVVGVIQDLPPGLDCTISFKIQANEAGTCYNATDPPTTTEIAGAAAFDSLTITQAGAAIWTGDGLDDDTTDAANWISNDLPAPDEDWTFPDSAAQMTVNNTEGPTVPVNWVSITGSNYNLIGNPFMLKAGIASSGANNMVSAPLVGLSPLVVRTDPGSASLTIAGGIDQQSNGVVFDGAGTTMIASTISGTTNLVFAGGDVTLTATPTNAGNISVTGGFSFINAATTQDINVFAPAYVGIGTHTASGTLTINDGAGVTIGDGTTLGTGPLTNLVMSGSTSNLLVRAGSELFVFGSTANVSGNVIVYYTMSPAVSTSVSVLDSTGGHLVVGNVVALSNLPNLVLTTQFTSSVLKVTVVDDQRVFANGFGKPCHVTPNAANAFAHCFED